MSADRDFIDTNILAYAFSLDEPQKMNVAMGVLNSGTVMISRQVLREYVNIAFKKMKMQPSEIIKRVNEITCALEVADETDELLKNAIRLKEKYGYSYYDSLIIASALTANCKYLYSEDMRHGQTIEGKLTIVNPFL